MKMTWKTIRGATDQLGPEEHPGLMERPTSTIPPRDIKQ